MYKNEYTINDKRTVSNFFSTVYGIKKMNNKRGIEFRRVLQLPDSPYLSNDETSEEYLENEGDVQGYDYRYSPTTCVHQTKVCYAHSIMFRNNRVIIYSLSASGFIYGLFITNVNAKLFSSQLGRSIWIYSGICLD